jgi:ABC-2 type transport system ATP-binding protein
VTDPGLRADGGQGASGTAWPTADYLCRARERRSRGRCFSVDGETAPALVADRAAQGALRLVGSATPSRLSIAPDEAPTPALALAGISKQWRHKPRPVLDNVDLRVAESTAILLTGRNGAGKTTLLRVASGLIAPDRGTVTVQGLSPERNRREFHRRITLLSAGDSGLYARLSVRRHLDLAARLALLVRSERAAAVDCGLDAFELRALAADRVDRLSMGQRQRMRVAMAFVHDPQLALLDEPTTSLDDHGVALLHAALSRLLSRGGAAIWCEPAGSRLDFAYDRRLVLDDGGLHDA